MTPTEIEKINREFAEKVMGWHIKDVWGIDHWVDDHSNDVMYVSRWDPYHRWDHAAMGLEKFECWYLKKITSPYKAYHSCDIFTTEDKGYSSGFADTAPAAICLACLEAKKEKE